MSPPTGSISACRRSVVTRTSSRVAAVGAAAPGTAAAVGAPGTAAAGPGAPGFGGAAAGAGMSASFACCCWGGTGGRVSFCHASHSIRSENEKMMNRMRRCVSMRRFDGDVRGRTAPRLLLVLGLVLRHRIVPARVPRMAAPDAPAARARHRAARRDARALPARTRSTTDGTGSSGRASGSARNGTPRRRR